MMVHCRKKEKNTSNWRHTEGDEWIVGIDPHSKNLGQLIKITFLGSKRGCIMSEPVSELGDPHNNDFKRVACRWGRC